MRHHPSEFKYSMQKCLVARFDIAGIVGCVAWASTRAVLSATSPP